MAVIIGRTYHTQLSELRHAILSKDPSIETRVLLDQEVKGQGRCYYCPNGPNQERWVEVTQTTITGISPRGPKEEVSRYRFHQDCLLDMLNS